MGVREWIRDRFKERGMDAPPLTAIESMLCDYMDLQNKRISDAHTRINVMRKDDGA